MALTPIRAEVRATLRTSGEALCGRILDVAQWPSFRGWMLSPPRRPRGARAA